MAFKIIKQLLSIPGLRIECPNSECNEVFPITKGKLFSMYDTYPLPVQKIIRKHFAELGDLQQELQDRKRILIKNKKKKPEKITISAQATNFGKISEQILPAFLTFPYKQTECRALFEPVDYLVFSNLSNNGHVDAIRFIDVKTGGGRLSFEQRQIRDCIADGKVKHKLIDL